MMQVSSPQRLSTHRAQPVACQNEDISQGVARRLSTAPVIRGSPSTPTRSTFPFKPAAVTPQGRRECPFRPSPPSSRSQKIYSPPLRCKTFPNIDDSPSQAIQIEAPTWMTVFTENVKTSAFFPVPVNIDDVRQDKDECWWLDDMNNWEPLREQPHITVRNFLMELRSETIDNIASTHSLVDDKEKSNELDDALRDLLILDKTPRALPEITSLQEQVLELKRYITSAHHLHEDKRERMHIVLQKIESVITTGKDEKCDEINEHEYKNTPSIEDYYRKTKVGLTGGSLVTAGLVLIPAPVIPGILVVYGGLLVLASEFDSAKTAVETIKVPMKELLKDEEDPNKGIYDCFYMIMWEEMIGYVADPELDEEFMAIMRMKPWKDNQNVAASDSAEIERARREKKNAMKRYARQLLLLEDPVGTHGEQEENNDKSVYSWMVGLKNG